MEDDVRLETKIVEKLVRRRVVGAHKKQVDTVKNWFASDEQGRVESLLREMIRDPEVPLQGDGESRDNVRLTSMSAAKRFILDNGGELPWGLRDE